MSLSQIQSKIIRRTLSRLQSAQVIDELIAGLQTLSADERLAFIKICADLFCSSCGGDFPECCDCRYRVVDKNESYG
jgi:hypothetical protein